MDPDGAITSYQWDFGDGVSGSGGRVSHAFSSDGSYVVRLTVSDDRESSDSTTLTVKVAASVTPAISLSATIGKQKNNKWVDLEWSGIVGSNVDVYRNGSLLTITENDGRYRDSTVRNRDKGMSYRVCEHDSSTCSDEVSP